MCLPNHDVFYPPGKQIHVLALRHKNTNGFREAFTSISSLWPTDERCEHIKTCGSPQHTDAHALLQL